MLSGDVQDFALRDVLQLLSTTNKSGLLTLYQAGSSGGVFVRDGGVCLALVDVTRVSLGRRIVAAGLAEAKVVRTTLRAVDSSPFDSVCALMRVVSDAGRARALVAEHTRDAIGWLSQYAEARFTFDPTVRVEAWPFEPLATEDVLAGVERNAAQWAELHAVVGDLSLVPHCAPSPKDSADVTVTTPQWRVVALIDGRRSIRDLTELVGLGQLELCRELGGLVDRGLVELVAPDGRHSAVTPLLDVEDPGTAAEPGTLPSPGPYGHWPDRSNNSSRRHGRPP